MIPHRNSMVRKTEEKRKVFPYMRFILVRTIEYNDDDDDDDDDACTK